ncbi:hypothetical protein Cgig2_020499 [Carnegiea gigantea]|uniref:RING-type E3 ubiquitin transferase (cysteine targeting) n=1 Tax=Carnegiea gigantea TaxID=171969 RepID=A0A9Q1QFU4_9CARY|nr:hypothetical protein Cgig2_020499 [Carnegiea gigantea]
MDKRTLASSSSSSSTAEPRIPIKISRVNQFDAARLDVEMTAMLKEQLLKVFSLLKPGILFQYEPELDAFLEFLIWRFSIWVDKSTPGNALMNLRCRDERVKEAREKVSKLNFKRHRPLAQRAWFLLQWVEGFYRAAAFGNLLIFLLTGKYRSLSERALRARLVYGTPNMNRSVSFEYMNRQLVWNEFSEMLLLTLPLLNSPSFMSLFRPFSKHKSSGSTQDETSCPICQAGPGVPFIALPCRHRCVGAEVSFILAFSLFFF